MINTIHKHSIIGRLRLIKYEHPRPKERCGYKVKKNNDNKNVHFKVANDETNSERLNSSSMHIQLYSNTKLIARELLPKLTHDTNFNVQGGFNVSKVSLAFPHTDVLNRFTRQTSLERPCSTSSTKRMSCQQRLIS